MSYDSQTNIANRHNLDTTFTAEYDNDQTAGIILTPTAGKRLKVVSIHISGDATSGRCRIYFPTSANTILVAYAGAGGVLAGTGTVVAMIVFDGRAVTPAEGLCVM